MGTRERAKDGGPVGGSKRTTPAPRPNGRHFNSVSYRDIEPATIASIVEIVAHSGGAVMFGRTSDEGAYSICILNGNEKIKEYLRDQSEMQQLLDWLAQEYFA